MVSVDDAVAALDAARARFDHQALELERQRASLAEAEAAARKAEAEATENAQRLDAELRNLIELRSLSTADGAMTLDIKVPHWAAGVLAWSLAESLGDARNYVETYFRHPDGEHVIAVTIQRKEGKRPAELVSEMRWVIGELLERKPYEDCHWCGSGDACYDDCPAIRARELCFVPSNVPGTDLPAPA